MQPWVRAVLGSIGVLGAGTAAYFGLRAAGLVGELSRGEGGSVLVNTLTLSSTKNEFAAAVEAAVTRVRPSASRQTQQLMAAWAAHESGWGKTRQAQLGFNLWNVSKGSWSGPVLDGGDTEYRNGQRGSTRITQQWRQYATLDAAVSDLLGLLQNSRYVNYREAYAKLMQGDAGFATALGVNEVGPNGAIQRVDQRTDSAGFYTAPRSKYAQSVSALMRDVQALTALAGLKSSTHA